MGLSGLERCGPEHTMSTLEIPLDQVASLRLAFNQDVPAALTGLSRACPGACLRSRPPVSAALTPIFTFQSLHEAPMRPRIYVGPTRFLDRDSCSPNMSAPWHGLVGKCDQEQDPWSAPRPWVCRGGLGGGGGGSFNGVQMVLHQRRTETRRILNARHLSEC